MFPLVKNGEGFYYQIGVVSYGIGKILNYEPTTMQFCLKYLAQSYLDSNVFCICITVFRHFN